MKSRSSGRQVVGTSGMNNGEGNLEYGMWNMDIE
jgi:hypothetical protein